MKKHTIVLTGGGTGGHITPILAVARELKRLQPELRIVYIGERNARFAELTKDNPDFDQTYRIFAGKFRRYHGESWLKRLFAIHDHLRNFRDLFYIALGLLQSWRILGKLQPSVVFLKGGYVGMPVGLVAGWKHIPAVTHDSDIVPGLANRLGGKKAVYHATGMPAEYYAYPSGKVRHVGVLVTDAYQPVTPAQQQSFKQELGLPGDKPLIFITGGSLGSRIINRAVVAIAPRLLERYPDLQIVHQVGKGNADCYGSFSHPHLQVTEFITGGMQRHSGAADVIITRAGATNLAEFGVQGKACVVIPNPLLTGGQQPKNAAHLLEQQAVEVVWEDDVVKDPTALFNVVVALLDDATRRETLGKRLQAITPADATNRVAQLLLEAAE